MSVFGIYDADFFHYSDVMPNLECAKLVAYFRNHNHVANLITAPDFQHFTKVYYRKEYNDGIFPKNIITPNCEYGGRAFNPKKYAPLPPEIEMTVPIIHIYDKYVNRFSSLVSHQEIFKRVLNCAHMRLAPYDEILPLEQLQKMTPPKYSGIFFHDYDLTSINAFEIIKTLSEMRHYRISGEVYPYPIGNKYPIEIFSKEELERWKTLTVIPNLFYLEYCGLMDNQAMYDLCIDNRRMARQINYRITYGCTSENDFFVNRLPQIFLQILFLRRSGVRFLLTYDERFFITKELEDLVRLLNCWLCSYWQSGRFDYETLFDYCRAFKRLPDHFWLTRTLDVTLDEIRNSFLYVRDHNYDLFTKFYQWDKVRIEGGKIVNDML